MNAPCPRCGHRNPPVGRFCGYCGLRLEPGPEGLRGAGQVRHRKPLAMPEAFEPIRDAVDLYFRWQAVGGGKPLLGTEPLEVVVFNGGYDLSNVELAVGGIGRDDGQVFTTSRLLPRLARGQQQTIEIPSWEMPDRVVRITVALRSAEFAADT